MKKIHSKYLAINLVMLFVLLVFFESTIGQIIHVPIDYATIQAAINAASNNDTVLVANGHYYENINFQGKAITVASHYAIEGDTTHISRTIIDGSQFTNSNTASTVFMVSGEDSTSVLAGFTITGGKGTIKSDFLMGARLGGGILIYKNGGKIINNHIKNNVLNDPYYYCGGAGICALPSDNYADFIIIQNNKITNNKLNTDLNQGAGIFTGAGAGNTLIEHNHIANNVSTNQTTNGIADGGGLIIGSSKPWSSNLVVRNNTIQNNSAKRYGGGIVYLLPINNFDYEFGISKNEIYNNIITGNTCDNYGGGIATYDNNAYNWQTPTLYITNNTIVHNYAPSGAGIYNFQTYPVILNNIIVNDKENEFYALPFDKFELKYNNINQTVNDTTNLNCKVLLDENFKPEQNCMVIGRGIDSIWIEDYGYGVPKTDFLGNKRPNPIDNLVDIGAIETDFLIPTTFMKKNIPSNQLVCYPNPIINELNIQYSITKSGNTSLHIYNILGEVITVKQQITLANTTYKTTIDFPKLNSGLYIVKLFMDNQIIDAKKVILSN